MSDSAHHEYHCLTCRRGHFDWLRGLKPYRTFLVRAGGMTMQDLGLLKRKFGDSRYATQIPKKKVQ